MATDDVDSFLRTVASAPALRPPPRIGERLGERYVIEAFLGEGGMGSVFRALDEKLGEQVALKIVKPGLDEDALRDEVRLAQKVTHVNVCRTFDLEEVDGRQIVKMEYIAGETLAVRLERDGKLAIDEAVRIARAIAAGLGVAHARGIVHSDLKPGNVMLADQRVVLMDFGVAHLAASPNDGVHGTVGYLAPEKLREESGDARGDEYALGCVLYEMLAGEAVFGRGSAIAIASRHVGEAPPDVRAKRPEVPRWLARAVSLLLAKDPVARSSGLKHLLDGRRSRVRIVVPSILVAVAIVLVTWRTMKRPEWEPRIEAQPIFKENITGVALSPDGQWIAIASDRDRALGLSSMYIASVRSGDRTRLDVPGYDNLGAPRWSRDGRSLYVVAYQSQTGVEALRLPIEGSPPHVAGAPEVVNGGAAAVEPCGDALLFSIWTPTQYRVTSNRRNEPLFVSKPFKTLSDPRCDRDGRQVAIVEQYGVETGDIYIVDQTTGAQRQLTRDHAVRGSAVFTPDGRSVVAGRNENGKTHLFEFPLDGSSPRQLTFLDGPDADPDITADGKVLLYTRDTGSFHPALIKPDGPHELAIQEGAFLYSHPFGRDTLVSQMDHDGRSSQVVLITLSTSKIDPLAAGKFPFPSSDLKSVYFTDADNSHFLDVVSIADGVCKRIATLPGEVVGGCDGPDGIHVRVSLDSAQFGYRIADHQIIDEHTHGLVCTAPNGGWKVVTVAGDETHPWPNLTLVPPGAPVSSGTSFGVNSMFPRWINDHTIAYCWKRCIEADELSYCEPECVEHDVVTNQRTVVATPAMAGGLLASMFDDHSVVDVVLSAQTNLQLITNFADR